jgi:hypothetical protein
MTRILEWLRLEIDIYFLFNRNYDEILQYHKNMPKNNNIEINDEAKFELVKTRFAFYLLKIFKSKI